MAKNKHPDSESTEKPVVATADVKPAENEADDAKKEPLVETAKEPEQEQPAQDGEIILAPGFDPDWKNPLDEFLEQLGILRRENAALREWCKNHTHIGSGAAAHLPLP